MTRRIGFAAGLVWMFFGAGCGALGLFVNLVQPDDVNVRLVNNGEFPVQVKLFIDDHQDIPRDLLTETGAELDFTVAVGQPTSFSRRCSALQAIVIDNAELRVVGGIGPEASTNVMRDGNDFGCGDTIVFTFDHSDLIVDFDVSVEVQRNQSSP